MPGSPAAKAGISSDDLIVYVDGSKVVSIEELQKILTACKPTDEAEARNPPRGQDGRRLRRQARHDHAEDGAAGGEGAQEVSSWSVGRIQIRSSAGRSHERYGTD